MSSRTTLDGTTRSLLNSDRLQEEQAGSREDFLLHEYKRIGTSKAQARLPGNLISQLNLKQMTFCCQIVNPRTDYYKPIIT